MKKKTFYHTKESCTKNARVEAGSAFFVPECQALRAVVTEDV